MNIMSLFLLNFEKKLKKVIAESESPLEGIDETVPYTKKEHYTVVHNDKYRAKAGKDPTISHIQRIHDEIAKQKGLLKKLRESEMTYGRRVKEVISEGMHQVKNTYDNTIGAATEYFRQRRRIKEFRENTKKDKIDIGWTVTGRAQNRYGGGRAMREAEEKEGRYVFHVGPGKAYRAGPEAAGQKILENMVEIYKKTGIKPESFKHRTDVIRAHSSGVNAAVRKLKEIKEKTGVKYMLGVAGDPYGSGIGDKQRIGTYTIGKMIDLKHESTGTPEGRKAIIKMHKAREKYEANPIRYDAAAGLGDELVKMEDAYDPRANKFYVVHGGKEHKLHTGHFAQASDLETNLLLAKIVSKGLGEVKKELKQEDKYREREYKKAA